MAKNYSLKELRELALGTHKSQRAGVKELEKAEKKLKEDARERAIEEGRLWTQQRKALIAARS